MASDTIMPIINKLQLWSEQGRNLPGYKFGNGIPYLYLLLGEKFYPHNIVSSSDKLEEKYPDVLNALNGPHAFAYLQIMIIRHNEKRDATNEYNTTGQD